MLRVRNIGDLSGLLVFDLDSVTCFDTHRSDQRKTVPFLADGLNRPNQERGPLQVVAVPLPRSFTVSS